MGSGVEVRIGDVVTKVGEILGRQLEVAEDDRRMRPANSEVSRLLSDSSKAARLAGWKAEISLDEGLRRTSEWIQRHIELFRPQEYAV